MRACASPLRCRRRALRREEGRQDFRSRREPPPASTARPSPAARRPALASVGRLTVPASVDDGVEHSHERAGERQVRPARIGGHMEEDDAPLAARGGGNERRAVAKLGPDFRFAERVGIGKHLAVHPSHRLGRQCERTDRSRENFRSAAAPPRRASRRAHARPDGGAPEAASRRWSQRDLGWRSGSACRHPRST